MTEPSAIESPIIIYMAYTPLSACSTHVMIIFTAHNLHFLMIQNGLKWDCKPEVLSKCRSDISRGSLCVHTSRAKQVITNKLTCTYSIGLFFC